MGSKSNQEKSSMSSDDKEKTDASDEVEVKRIVKTSAACFVSFLVSFAGGLMLAWWRCEYQRDNRQLWMVPFGLILLVTPLIIWVSVLFSDNCGCRFNFKTNDNIISRPTIQYSNPSLQVDDDSIPDPERL